MSITFNRLDLIAIAKDAVTSHEGAIVAYEDAAIDVHKRAELEHWNKHHAKLKVLRDECTKALRTGRIPTRAQMQKRTGVNDLEYLFYREPDSSVVKREIEQRGIPEGYLDPAQLSAARTLILTLEAANGDEVTVNELTKVGLKNLELILAAAAR
jgi:hypothetical protein